jgi:hypothetical protein
MALKHNKRAVGVFSRRQDTELALRELRDANFPMDRVSVITQDKDKNNITGTGDRDEVREHSHGNKADEGAKTGAITGGALGGITGLLVGLGTLAIPGIGPIMLAGATATAIATTLAGGAIGAAAGGLLGALIGLGIPEERARVYNDRVSRGHYLVLVEGSDDEIRRAEAILHNRGIEEWGVYDHPDSRTTTTTPHTTLADRDRRDYTTSEVHRQDLGVVPGRTDHVTPRSTVGRHYRALGVFPHRRDAEAALRDLRGAGFDMNHISLVGKDSSGKVQGGNVADRTMTDEGAKAGAATGGILGGLGGLLVGLGALAIPGIGPVIAGGALATALATTAAGGAIGAAAGGLTGALVGLGIPDDKARFYNDRVARGDYLVMVDGTEDEIRRADTILSRHGVQDWQIFDAPHGDRTDYGTRTTSTANREVLDRDNYTVVSDDPNVVIIDRRDQTR